jgi:hypothetical protein
MFGFLLGVAFGAAGYWAWNSFGRDLLGMGDQGETTYGSFNTSTTPTTSFSSTPATSTTPSTPSSSDASSPSSGSIGATQTGGE